MSEPEKNPHDRFVKAALGERNVALELLREYLPPEIKALVRIEDYELVKQSFVDRELDENITDILFKLPMIEGGGVSYFYNLLEHQRTVCKLMAFRDITAKVKIADFHMKRYKTTKIPLIHTIVLYNGKQRYSATLDLVDLVDGPRDLAKAMWRGPYQLVDVSHIPDKKIKERIWLGVFLMMLKHIDNPRIIEILLDLTYHLNKIAREASGLDFLSAVLGYLFRAANDLDAEYVVEVVKHQIFGKTRRQGHDHC
ncbi:MAG: Rpn family recombination-promoting nuclease/putative transposase [Gammaproteobacteria bacterium]|nr:Rpn family recombination-promoting nuclease/putative transposase [Gammaproteobacteria bacterium]